jgi:hypothetical protein
MRKNLESKPRAMIGMIMNKCNKLPNLRYLERREMAGTGQNLKEIVELLPYMEDICWQGGEVFLMAVLTICCPKALNVKI